MVDPTCFVCAGPVERSGEKVGDWLRPRFACPFHKRQATLLSGERLDDFLDRRSDKTYPFEGSLLNYVINPVLIANQRGWCDFLFESPAIIEEIFPSDTYFDFCAQHLDALVPVLYAIYQQREQLGSNKNLITVLMMPSFQLLMDAFERLTRLWQTQEAVQYALQQHGWQQAPSPDDALKVLKTVQARNFNVEVFSSQNLINRLLELGEQRFTNL